MAVCCQLVSALGLLAVSTVVVDLVMIYAMPHRAQYTEEKIQLTKDFHPDNVPGTDSSIDLNKNLVRERLLTEHT